MRGVPDLTQLQAGVDEYVAMRGHAGDHRTRALACWGLVAVWPVSRDAVSSLLQSSREEDIEDAAGILGRVGIPDDMLRTVVSLIESLPDSTARHCLVQSLPLGHPRRAPEAMPAAESLDALADVPLQGEWEPYTGRIQFVEAGFDAVTNEFSAWMATPNDPAVLALLGLPRQTTRPKHSMSRHSGSLAALLSRLDPYWWPSKTLFVETQFGWTAVFSNGHDSYEASVLSGRMGKRGVVTDYAADLVINGEVRNYGNTLFELIDRGESVRTVQASRQSGGWDAVLLGTPLPFEEVQKYQARVKRERFDLGMLNRYCAALGINRSDGRTYGPRAFLHYTKGETNASTQHPLYPTAAAWRAANLR
jgi:hypothetical protein